MIYHYTITGSIDGAYFEFWYWSSRSITEDEWQDLVAQTAVKAVRAIKVTKSINLNNYDSRHLYVLLTKPEFKDRLDNIGFHLVTVKHGCHLTGDDTEVHRAIHQDDIETKLEKVNG